MDWLFKMKFYSKNMFKNAVQDRSTYTYEFEDSVGNKWVMSDEEMGYHSVDSYLNLDNGETVYACNLEGGDPMVKAYFVGKTGSTTLTRVYVDHVHFDDIGKFDLKKFEYDLETKNFNENFLVSKKSRFAVVVENNKTPAPQNDTLWYMHSSGTVYGIIDLST